jgi:hypothetical protein
MVDNGIWAIKARSQSRHALGQEKIFASQAGALGKSAGLDDCFLSVGAVAGGKVSGRDNPYPRLMHVAEAATGEAQYVLRVANEVAVTHEDSPGDPQDLRVIT